MRLGLFATWPRQINPNRRKAWNVSGRFSCFVTRSLILLYHPILRILWPHSKARVQPFIGIGAVPSVITGNPDPAMISTSHVERNNRTMRTFLRRVTRLSLGFSKKSENLQHAVALHIVCYNFCRVHRTLRATPAMEAGITDHVWTIQELVAV